MTPSRGDRLRQIKTGATGVVILTGDTACGHDFVEVTRGGKALSWRVDGTWGRRW